MSEEEIKKLPNLELSSLMWKLQTFGPKQSILDTLMTEIKDKKMSVFYKTLCTTLKLPQDQNLLTDLTNANKETLEALNKKIENAKENEGESEVRLALLAKAEHFASIGDFPAAIQLLKDTSEKTVGVGGKLDISLTLIRIAFFLNDADMIKRNLDIAKGLIEEGGDWDRRNRLKVYEAYYLTSIRQFEQANELFLETIATFNSTELFDFTTFVFYTVITSVFSLERRRLKEEVVKNPEILRVIHKVDGLREFLESFYDGAYDVFFQSMAKILEKMNEDKILHPHVRYFCREMRIKAYSQLLASYRSVQLASMAKNFGVSEAFMDKELSRFIASGRLRCKIDKVGGIVETGMGAGTKNHLYQEAITKGDNLLNKLEFIFVQVSS